MAEKYGRWSAEDLATLRLEYPHVGARALAERFGRTAGSIRAKAGELGVRMTDEGRRLVVRAAHDRSKAKLRRLYKTEYLRMLSGQPRETCLKLRELPRRTQFMMYELIRVRNYYGTAGKFPAVLYYDGETRRRDDEARITREYGIRFEGGESPLQLPL